MVNRALGVYVLGIVLVQLALLFREFTSRSSAAAAIPLWSPLILIASMAAIGYGSVRLVRRGEVDSTAASVGLGLLMTWVVAQFLFRG